MVFLWAVGLRAVFALLTADTYDSDEFVILALGRSMAHGAAPYRDVVFFHPPGMLVFSSALQRLVTWWPTGRILTMLLDSMTAVLVWRVGRELFGEVEALVAGLLYAASPITLISAVRIGPDPLITAFGFLGLLLLLTVRVRAGAVLAGLCLALAVWTKYPAILFLPIYLLAAPQRARTLLLAWLAGCFCLFAPYAGEAHDLYSQTVLWQLAHRANADLLHRLSSVGAYWLLLNPLAVLALRRRNRPAWLQLGFCLGAVFLLTSQAYYHYFVMVVPFAALLAAPLVASYARRSLRLLAASALSLTCLWGLDMSWGTPALQLFVSASRFSAVRQTVAVLDRLTPPNATVLTDEFEYALLSHRRLAVAYFWNMATVVRAATLEHRVPLLGAVVMTKGGPTYPPGFTEYLERSHYRRIQTAGTVVWLVSSRMPRSGSGEGEE